MVSPALPLLADRVLDLQEVLEETVQQLLIFTPKPGLYVCTHSCKQHVAAVDLRMQ